MNPQSSKVEMKIYQKQNFVLPFYRYSRLPIFISTRDFSHFMG